MKTKQKLIHKALGPRTICGMQFRHYPVKCLPYANMVARERTSYRWVGVTCKKCLSGVVKS